MSEKTIPTPKQAEEARQKAADAGLDAVMEIISDHIVATAPDNDNAIRIDANAFFHCYETGTIAAMQPKIEAALDAAGWVATWEGGDGARAQLVLMPKGD